MACVYNSGFSVQGLGFEVYDSGFRVQGSRFEVYDSGFSVQFFFVFVFTIQNLVSRVQRGCRLLGFGLRKQRAAACEIPCERAFRD